MELDNYRCAGLGSVGFFTTGVLARRNACCAIRAAKLGMFRGSTVYVRIFFPHWFLEVTSYTLTGVVMNVSLYHSQFPIKSFTYS